MYVLSYVRVPDSGTPCIQQSVRHQSVYARSLDLTEQVAFTGNKKHFILSPNCETVITDIWYRLGISIKSPEEGQLDCPEISGDLIRTRAMGTGDKAASSTHCTHGFLRKAASQNAFAGHNCNMAGAGASENDEQSAAIKHSPANLEKQKKEITEKIKKTLRKGDTW